MRKRTALLLGGEVIALAILYWFTNSNYIEKVPVCWIYQSTGLLCPACGGTRCVISILQGNWVSAFFSHMIFFVGIVYLLILNVVIIININKEKKAATWLYPKYWYGIIFVIVLLLYTILRNLL